VKSAAPKTCGRSSRRSPRSQGDLRPVARPALRGPARCRNIKAPGSETRRHGPSDDFYDTIKPRLHRRIGRELRLAGRVLDLGCGCCDLVRYLAETFHQHVTGVDVSDGSFPRRHHAPGAPRFRCIRRNAEHLDFAKDESRDAIVSMWALHEMKHPGAILREARRILRPGGEILIVDFPKHSLAQRLWHEGYYTPGQIKSLLTEARFQNVHVRVIEQDQIIWAKGFRSSVEEPSEPK